MPFWQKPRKGSRSPYYKKLYIKLLKHIKNLNPRDLLPYKFAKVSSNGDWASPNLRGMNEIVYRNSNAMKLPCLLYFGLLILTSCEQPVGVDIPPSREWTIEELIADLSKTIDEVIEEEIHIDRLESNALSRPDNPSSGEEEDQHVLIQLQTIYARIARVVDGDNRDAFMYLVRRMAMRKVRAISQQVPMDLRPEILRIHDQHSDQSWASYNLCAREILPAENPDCVVDYVREVVGSLSHFTEQTAIPSYPF
jgi:hypothetical protein